MEANLLDHDLQVFRQTFANQPCVGTCGRVAKDATEIWKSRNTYEALDADKKRTPQKVLLCCPGCNWPTDVD